MASHSNSDYTIFHQKHSESQHKEKHRKKKKKKTKSLNKNNDTNDCEDYEKRHRYIKKLRSYIKSGRVKKIEKLVSIFRARKWNKSLDRELNRREEKNQNWTYLHRFSSEGNSSMVNVLLDLNMDVADMCDIRGNNFLHLAFNYILKSFDRGFLSYVTDNVLMRVDNQLMEGRNFYGETPVDLLDEIVELLQSKQAFQFVEIENENESEMDDTEWNEKLFFEMGQEEGFRYEAFSQDEFADTYKKVKSETFTEWGDRIWKEYNQKKRKSAELGNPDVKRQRRTHQNSSKHRMQENSPRCKRSTEHLKELRSNLLLLESRDKYEEKCHQLFKHPNATSLLGINDFPWVHFPKYNPNGEIDSKVILSSMVEMFSCGLNDEDKIKYFKVQRIRWHPDKFLQKCGHRLEDKSRECILELVKSISQTINSTLSCLEQ